MKMGGNETRTILEGVDKTKEYSTACIKDFWDYLKLD